MALMVYASRQDSRHLVIVIGLGLIGSSICKELQHGNYLSHQSLFCEPSWTSANEISQDLIQIINSSNALRVDVIWSAGKAGFGADKHLSRAEYEVYAEVMRSLTRVTIDVTVSLLSSAGGLYEGIGYVEKTDRVQPLRPYAYWKLEQEQLLKQLDIKYRIYRISSVYGFNDRAGRAGLINTIITQCRNKGRVTIFGNQNTMRDYILNDDVSRYIVAQINSNQKNTTEILATGRAVSIAMLLNLVGKIAGISVRAIYIDDQLENSRDIKINPRLLPVDLKITSLEEGVRKTWALVASV